MSRRIGHNGWPVAYFLFAVAVLFTPGTEDTRLLATPQSSTSVPLQDFDLRRVPRTITVEYRIHFETVYTGAPGSYLEEAGTTTVEIGKRDELNWPHGLPIHEMKPVPATVIKYTRYNGQEGTLYVGASDGAIDYPGLRRHGKIGVAVQTKILKIGSDHYLILAALTDEELARMS